MTKIVLTKNFVSDVQCPAGKAKLDVFDIGCRGLMLEVRPTGRAAYYLRYVDARGIQRQHKICDSRDLSLDLARKEADKLRARLAQGEDIKQSKQAHQQVPTISTFIHDRYLPFVQGYKKSWECDRGLLKNHIEPLWGKRYLDQITKADLIGLFAEHRKTHAPASCNRLLILLRYMFNLAIRWETPGIVKNPTTGFPLMKEDNKHERFLSSAERVRVFLQSR